MDVGVIGGTGVGGRLAAMGGVPLAVPTVAGILRGRVIQNDGISILVVRRHSAGHTVPPHKVGYAAMAYGFRQLGVKACLATAAVGSLRREWVPGTLVVCSDFLDFSNRNLTLFDDQVVHTDFSQPFADTVREALIATAVGQQLEIEPKGVYINANGPRYETPHEIEVYRQMGGELVGMTAASEAILMREAGVPYGCLAIVSNLAAGMTSEPLSHSGVVEVMEAKGEQVLSLLLATATMLGKQGA